MFGFGKVLLKSSYSQVVAEMCGRFYEAVRR